MEYFNKKVNELEKEFKTDINNGLKDEEIQEKRNTYGYNELEKKKKKSIVVKFL